jgi:hypothetical protein
LCFLFLPFISCKKPGPGSIVIDADFTVLYKDTNGIDILNPAVSGAIKAEDIDVYVLKNGVKTQVNYANLDYPEMFSIKKSAQNFYYMLVYFDVRVENFNGNRITQFVRYKDGTEDEFIGEFNTNRRTNTLLQRVWVNGVFKNGRECQQYNAH